MSAEDSVICAKGNEFNNIFQILQSSTKTKNVDSMISFVLLGLLEKYPENFNEFVNNMNTMNADFKTVDANEEFDNDNYDDYADSCHSSQSSQNLENDNYADDDNNGFNFDNNIMKKESNEESMELLLDPKYKRFTAYPIQFPFIWNMYKSQQAAYWVTTEIDFSKDYDDFQKLNEGEQHFIKMIIAFFANSDGIVNWNLSERFTKEIQVTEALYAYQWQIMMENIHSEVYSLMLENIVKDEKEKDTMFNAIHTIPSIKAMADWAFNWIESDKSFAHRLVAFAIVEGIFFSGAFASIFWIKTHKGDILPGLTKSNEFIARDEGMHCEFACELYNYIENKLPTTEMNDIMIDAVKIAQMFMRDALPIRLIGMNQNFMDDYIEYIGDRLITMLGYKKIFKKKNPFEFMSKIGLANKENFFEHRNASYQDSTINNKSVSGVNFSEVDEEYQE